MNFNQMGKQVTFLIEASSFLCGGLNSPGEQFLIKLQNDKHVDSRSSRRWF